MKTAAFLSISISLCLASCGPSSSETGESSKSTKSAKGHYFSKPYECTRQKDVTSKRTGKTNTLTYKSYYSPQKRWRIDLKPLQSSTTDNTTGGIALLYTPDVRYDGRFRRQGEYSIKFVTAWPRKDTRPEIALSNLSLYKKRDCKPLADESVFEFDYLDTLKVMGQ